MHCVRKTHAGKEIKNDSRARDSVTGGKSSSQNDVGESGGDLRLRSRKRGLENCCHYRVQILSKKRSKGMIKEYTEKTWEEFTGEADKSQFWAREKKHCIRKKKWGLNTAPGGEGELTRSCIT